jgi:hypothetical protein
VCSVVYARTAASSMRFTCHIVICLTMCNVCVRACICMYVCMCLCVYACAEVVIVRAEICAHVPHVLSKQMG